MNHLFRPLYRQSLNSTGIYLLIVALTLAISAATALKFSHTQIKQAVALQAAEMLAADLVINDYQAIDPQWEKKAAQAKLQQAKVTVFSSMAQHDEQFVMVNVKAVDQGFPLRGDIGVWPQHQQLAAGEVWLSQRAMDLLHAKVGDRISIADGQFTVAAKIEHDSNQELGFSAFSPTVMIAQQDIAATNAIQVGSRIEYRLLLAGDPEQIKAFETDFKKWLKTATSTQALQRMQAPSVKMRNASQGNTRLMKPMENFDTFLQLANILTILLCGIAIALTAQRYVQQNQDYIAVLRCMGAKKSQILSAYLALLALVWIISVVLGAALGMGLGWILLQLMLALIPQISLQFSLWNLLIGPLPIAMFSSAILLVGFVWPSLLQLFNTPPVRVIRQQKSSARAAIYNYLIGGGSLLLLSLFLTGQWRLSVMVIAGVLLLCLLLYAVVYLSLKLIRATKSPLSSYVRVPRQSAFQVTALALGLSLMSVLLVLKTDVLQRWQQQLPAKTANQFVYGLPVFDLPVFKEKIQQNKWSSSPLYANIKGRLLEKNHQPFSSALIQQNNALRRELNLTQTDHYPENNVIVEGRADFRQAKEVSVEINTAKALGIQVGDQLSFSLPEGILTAQVINLRQVEWESFSPNFFFIFSPQSMDANAGSYLGSFYVPPEDHAQLLALIQQFSNTVFIDLSLILQEIKNLLAVLLNIISVLAVLVGGSGFLVLLACLNLLLDERKKEVALLRCFGASQQQLKTILTIELGFIGLMAGIVACIFAEVVSAIASTQMNLPMQLHAVIWLILPLGMTVLCAVIGRYRLGYLVRIPPLASLMGRHQP